MTNTYYNHTTPIARFTTADANKLNTSLKAIEAGFDKLPSATELNQGSRNYAAATNIGNAYSVTVPFVLTSYSAGLQVTFLAATANTGASTLNVNAVGPADLRRFDGTALVQGDIRAVSLNTVVFDGTSFRLTSMHGASEGIAASAAVSASASAVQAAASASSAASSAASASTSASNAAAASASSLATLTATRFGIRNLLINPLFWMAQRHGNIFGGTYAVNSWIRDRWKVATGPVTWSITNSVLTIAGGTVSQVVQGRNIPVSGAYTLSWQGTSAATVNGLSVTNGGQVNLNAFANATVVFGAGTMGFPQLEYSPIKTQFEFRPTDIERLLCFQYFQKSYNADVAVGTVTNVGAHVTRAASTIDLQQGMLTFGYPMRGSPVLTIWNPRFAGVAGSFDDMESGFARGVAAEVCDRGASVFAAIADLVPGNRHRYHWSADAEL